MNRVEFQPIGALLKEYIDEVHLSEGFTRLDVYECWEKAVGKEISRYTINLFFNKGILYCTLSSSLVRNRLYFNLDGIRNELNRTYGKAIVDKIVLK